MEMLPSFTARRLTERFSRSADEEDGGSGFDDLVCPPTLEKFHLPPGVWINRICGWSSTRSLTLSFLEKISGTSSTPICRLLACTKGSLLNAGSSAIERSSAETLPESMDKPRFPTFTSRPSAAVRVDSSFGRKLFTLMTKGKTRSTARMTARTMPTIFRAFMGALLGCSLSTPGSLQSHLRCVQSTKAGFSRFRRAAGRASPLQRLLQVGNQVIGIFNSHGKPQHLFGNSHLHAMLSRDHHVR